MNPPYYINPLIEEFHHSQGAERAQLGRHITAAVCDSVQARIILGVDPADFESFYPARFPNDLSTEDTIDSFISRYGAGPVSDFQHPKKSRPGNDTVPLEPAPFSLAELEALPEASVSADQEDETASMLSAFLDSPEHKKQPAHSAPNKPECSRSEAPVLSESLAKAMIKNGNYTKALEIITDLSLNNPKKSIYFADQIRFLKKLILNQSKGPLPE